MAGYDQVLNIKNGYLDESKNFIRFLNIAARRYHVSIRFKIISSEQLYVEINGTPGTTIDAFFAEIIITKALFYYICSVDRNKLQVKNKVVIPIYKELLNNRFENPYSRKIRENLKGKGNTDTFVPGNYRNKFARQYEILFTKFELGLINESDFLEDCDKNLTHFMLHTIEHIPGNPSQEFGKLAIKAQQKGIVLSEETLDVFIKIHNARNNDLHRIMQILSKEELIKNSVEIHNYFGYYDEFLEAQQYKYNTINGKKVYRCKFGKELWVGPEGNAYDIDIMKGNSCPDCYVAKNQYHVPGCDWEQCPNCRQQALSCSCKFDEFEDTEN